MEKKPNYSFNLVIGISGPYGAGASSLSQELYENLVNWPGGDVERLSAASLIKKYYKYYFDDEIEVEEKDDAQRRKVLQNAGTQMRLMDRLATAKIFVAEITKSGKASEEEKEKKGEVTGTRVYIIDCLKNGNEVNELRRVYGDEFYLVYIHASRENRWRREVDYKGWSADKRVDFEDRDSVDYNEVKNNPAVKDAGQEVRKLSTMADYYIVNNYNRERLKEEADRFLNLLFGDGKNQPTIDERSMHIAFSASNRSYCLSRQVGAAIIDDNGVILGVGHNDVPKANGGLYTQEDGEGDKRCYLVGDRRCINDTNKQERIKQLKNEMLKEIEPDSDTKEKLEQIVNDSAFKELTEFCRAVHAEMEALISVCRAGRGSTFGGTMYVTAQPCHNCTKHIICSGIKKVIYLEPYPKSLGLELHSDAIDLDPIDDRCLGNKIVFSPYGGVSPHRYHDFFIKRDDRKKKGGHYLKKSKLEQANNPRFANRLIKRTRILIDPLHPNSVTANELAHLNMVGSMVEEHEKRPKKQ